jgi:hypothetical protein
MQFEKNNLSFAFLVLAFVLFFQIGQILKRSESLQYEIFDRKINIKKDSPGILRLLPGVGPKKAQEIMELRKSEISQDQIIENTGLTKRKSELVFYLESETENLPIKEK